VVLGEFESWLQSAMATRGVRSVVRLAKEAGLEPTRLGDWAVGRGVPDDRECSLLAAYFGVAVHDVRRHAKRPAR
jgi:hypothetical protein